MVELRGKRSPLPCNPWHGNACCVLFRLEDSLGIQFGSRTSLVAQMVKRLSTMRETWVRALGWEDPLEKEMAIHSSTAGAAAAAKSLQSCLTVYDPIDSSPPGLSVPGILQARTLEWVAISFSRDLPNPGLFPTQGSNPGLPHCRQTLHRLSQQGRSDEVMKKCTQ